MLIVALSVISAAPALAAEPQTRCGWVDNETPGNFTLLDRDGAWVIAAQGGYQAKGFDTLPDLSEKEFAELNAPHGYSCDCLKVTVDARRHRIAKIFGVTLRTIKDCQDDRRVAPSRPHF